MSSKTNSGSKSLINRLTDLVLAVPVRVKIAGNMTIPIVILGLVLSYWIRTGLSDWLSYLLSDVRVQAAMRAGTRSVVFVTILAAAFSTLLTYVLMYILTEPLIELRNTAQRVAGGDLSSRSRVYAEDEIGIVAQSVNAMIDHLVASQVSLQRTNRRLEAMNRVAMAATTGEEVHDILYHILTGILDLLELKMGWIYLFDSERDIFHLASWGGLSEDLEGLILHQEGDTRWTCMQSLAERGLGMRAEIRQCERLDEACPTGQK